jgi:PBSX family phage terminase large subunit
VTGRGFSHKQMDSVLDSQARLNIWHGSIRSGKTVASLFRWLQFVRTAPPGPLAILGKTKDTIARNVQEKLAEFDPDAINYTASAPSCNILGRTVWVIGGNDEKAQKKIQGLTLAGAYLDEVATLPEGFWKMTTGRMSIPGAKLFGTTNPDNPSHWLKKTVLDRASELNLYEVHFKLEDNPSLEKEYLDGIKSEYTGLWYKRYIDGLWVSAEGAIYDQLDEAVHCRPAPPKANWQALWLGIDYGTSNPTHAVLIALCVDAQGGESLHAVAEWQHDGRAKGQLTDAQISTRLAEWLTAVVDGTDAPLVPVLDPSAASLRTQMRADGWPGLRAADNRVDVGLRTVSSLFTARLFVDKAACSVLWGQLCGYVWDDKALSHGEEKPVKTDDHGPDALRYGVMSARQVWRHWLPDLAATTERAA